mgnify:CR=1 FL=1
MLKWSHPLTSSKLPRDLLMALAYGALIALASAIIIGIGSYQYSNYVDRKNKQQWCVVVSVMDDAYKANPPQSSAGKKLAEEFHRMRTDFNCPKE